MNNVQNPPLACSFWSKHNGTGRTVMGNLRSVVTTIIQVVKGFFNRTNEPLKKPGKQFSGSALNNFINTKVLEKVPEIMLVNDYYLCDHSTITNKHTVEKMKNRIDNIEKGQKAIAIPIVLKKKFHRNHVVLALVIDNNVEYYNSVGETSDKFKLADEKTLRDFLEKLKDKFTDNGEIIENKTTHQFDAYNCGAYVTNYIYQRAIKNKSAEVISHTPYSHKQIVAFRNN